MHPNEVRIHGKKYYGWLSKGKAIESNDYPELIQRLVDEKGYKYYMQAILQKLLEIQPLDIVPEVGCK